LKVTKGELLPLLLPGPDCQQAYSYSCCHSVQW
jgi:hypothetical protein